MCMSSPKTPEASAPPPPPPPEDAPVLDAGTSDEGRKVNKARLGKSALRTDLSIGTGGSGLSIPA